MPLSEEDGDAQTPPDVRWRTAFKIVGMTVLGMVIGCGFVVLRRALGLESL